VQECAYFSRSCSILSRDTVCGESAHEDIRLFPVGSAPTAINQNSALRITAAANGDGTDAGWYAVSTVARHEKQVARFLQIRGIEHYLPLYRVNRRWRDGSRVMLDLPLFPCYLFTKIHPAERRHVLQVPSVIGFVNGVGREPARLADELMESLRNGLSICKAEPYPLLLVGQRGRIKSGILSGLEGVLLRTGNDCKMVLTVDLIMQSVAVEVAAEDLEVLPAAS
jgi:transcription antitermination factor NusG